MTRTEPTREAFLLDLLRGRLLLIAQIAGYGASDAPPGGLAFVCYCSCFHAPWCPACQDDRHAWSQPRSGSQ